MKVTLITGLWLLLLLLSLLLLLLLYTFHFETCTLNQENSWPNVLTPSRTSLENQGDFI